METVSLQIRLPFLFQPDISAVVVTAPGICLFIFHTVSKELRSNLKRTVNLGHKGKKWVLQILSWYCQRVSAHHS